MLKTPALILIAALSASHSFASTEKGTYEGVTPKGKLCSIHLLTVTVDKEDGLPLIQARIPESSLDFRLTPVLTLAPESRVVPDTSRLRGTHGDDQQAEILVLKLDGSGTPESFYYYDNTGWRGWFGAKKLACNKLISAD